MSDKILAPRQRRQIENFLAGYSMNKKMLRMAKYEREFFGGGADGSDGMPCEEPLAKARMYEVRHFILSLDNSDEKLFLYYHYVKGDSVERCAELLGISTRTAYRLKARALELAYRKGIDAGVIATML